MFKVQTIESARKVKCSEMFNHRIRTKLRTDFAPKFLSRSTCELARRAIGEKERARAVTPALLPLPFVDRPSALGFARAVR